MRFVLTEKVPRTSATMKFNSGNGSLNCSRCSATIKVGYQFSAIEKMHLKGEWNLRAQYCNECKSKYSINFLDNEICGMY